MCDLRRDRDGQIALLGKKKIYTWVEHRSGTEKAERILEWGKVARTVRGVDMSNIAS